RIGACCDVAKMQNFPTRFTREVNQSMSEVESRKGFAKPSELHFTKRKVKH
ncbi:hypothetical protein CDAR_546531, partial [Caerostris darwini]